MKHTYLHEIIFFNSYVYVLFKQKRYQMRSEDNKKSNVYFLFYHVYHVTSGTGSAVKTAVNSPLVLRATSTSLRGSVNLGFRSSSTVPMTRKPSMVSSPNLFVSTHM